MRRVGVIARREYWTNVRTKAFLISLVLMPLLMTGSFIAQRAMRGRVDVEPKRVMVSDQTGVLLPALVRAAEERNREDIFDPVSRRQVEARYLIEAAPWPALDDQRRVELSQQIRKRQLHGFAEIDAGVLAGDGRARFHSESAMTGQLASWFNRRLNEAVQLHRLRATGIDPEVVRKATAPVRLQGLGLYSVDKKGRVTSGDSGSRLAASFLPFGVVLLMFLALIMSQTMLTSTLEEKQQRIAEVMLGSVRPFELMAGKLAGGAATSLTMVTVYLIGGAVVLRRFGYADLLRTDLVVWTLIFLVLGVMIYGSLYAAVGAACSELKEAQNLLMPIMIVLVAPLMIVSKVMEEPMGNLATTLSFVPVWTPMLMPMRLAATQAVPLWQPIVGALGALAAAAFAAWAGGRVLRVGLLLQGKPPRLGQLVQWVIRG